MKKIIKKKEKNLAFWTVAWVLTFFLLASGPNELWNSKSITIIALIINVIVAVGMLLSNRDLFEYYDELQKKVQLEAMAITLGISVIFGCLFEQTYKLGLINLKPKLHIFIMFIGMTYLIAVIINSRRYK
tara:strand:+ start:112 stop:501 length:390 start_codon:yes stop_codon:yes gene_type:complete